MDGQVDEVDPELVVVFDLAGSVKDFHNAVSKVTGLEFLTEHMDVESEPDDDFHMEDPKTGRTDATVQHSLYLVMSNATAVTQLIQLFELWKNDPSFEFQRGQGRFRAAFDQLAAIRRWGPNDRIRDTGLAEKWRERLEIVGQSHSPVLVEIELWYRQNPDARRTAQEHVEALVAAAQGEVKDHAQISQIAYHALLVEIPVQQVQALLDQGAEAVALLNADEIMFVSPFTPMTVTPTTEEFAAAPQILPGARIAGLPRIALFDGLPFVNHDLLAGRLVVDDPDGIGDDYAALARLHGTAMASLLIHGDLSAPGEPLDRPLYVRPIMRPAGFNKDREQVVGDRLFTDLLHRAVVRMVNGEGSRAASAQSVRVVNLSIGCESRALVRRMSPLGRLLDWLAWEFNLLFVVSAGNHARALVISAAAADNLPLARSEALSAARRTSLLRGILPPGDALNALTVGATHGDAAGSMTLPDTVWDIHDPDMPAMYSAVGPGVGRSVKPDLFHIGGRAVYIRPVLSARSDPVELHLAPAGATGPGNQVAAPRRGGATNATQFTYGTSNATALVTREASRLFDLLEHGANDVADLPFPDSLFHPVLVKALLVHACSWGLQGNTMRDALNLDSANARRELTALLGYGNLNTARLGGAATNRAVLISGARIGRNERHTYSIPLPGSLRARAEWRRFTVTLAYLAPTVGHLTRYRGAKVFFDGLDESLMGGKRIEADYHAVRRGACQHEIIDGSRATVFADQGFLPIHVECMDDAQRLPSSTRIRYGLVISIEAAVSTSTTIHDEVRAQLRVQARSQARPRLQP